MLSNPISGVSYFFQGLSLIFKPGIRQWMLIPLLINIILFSALIYLAWSYFPIASEFFIAQVQGILPDWTWLVDLMRWLMLPLFIVLALTVIFFCFTFVANIIGGPFNSLLSAAVEKHLTGEKPVEASSDSLFKGIISAIAESISRLFYYVKWAIVLLIISFVPMINIASPILWFLFAAWLICLEYADVPLGKNNYNFSAQRKLLAEKRLLALGFGSTVTLVMLIPVINFFVMPTAVAGATAMWVHEFKGRISLQIE
jgi:CysZ protein